MQKKWQRIVYMPATPLYGDGHPVTASAEHIALSLEAARDGMVLLKNEQAVLPFRAGVKLALFGKAQADYVKGGGGSGDVTVPYTVSPLDALRGFEQAGRLTLCGALSDYYAAYVAAERAAGKEPGRLTEPELPEELLNQAKAEADTAVVFLCRYSGEGWDRTGKPGDGDFYPSPEEQRMIEQVRGAFDRVVVVLNTGGMMDVSWFKDDDRIQGAVLAWQGGLEGGRAVAELLMGDFCPSGRLTDTFAVNFDAYPSADTFNESDTYVAYHEGIYVGYRYFETLPGADGLVCYPFGYGLSYTSFELGAARLAEREGGFAITVPVTNTGARAGRQVVQAYCEAPQGKLDKPRRVLVGFRKTALLQPGEREEVCIPFTRRDLASYDDEGVLAASCWLLEAGEYRFLVGDSVRSVQPVEGGYRAANTEILERLAPRCRPQELDWQLRADGAHAPVQNAELKPRHGDYSAAVPFEFPRELPEDAIRPNFPVLDEAMLEFTGNKKAEPVHTLSEVAEGQMTLDAFIDQLSDERMVRLLGGQPNRGVANTFGMGNLRRLGIPNMMTADGPQGLRVQPETGASATAFPCATQLACTWDTELAERVGRAAAEEVLENGIGMWLAPAMNIHRNPLCGRNFEYYSEDPLVSGCMAAAVVRGVQSIGVSACIKHFACNNKEVNRVESDSRLSERALREIYLRGFEICVRTAHPWALMTAYNLVNGVRASENRELLTDILRDEWGFDGVVTTDWWNHGLQYREIAAGNDVKMGTGMPEMTLVAVQSGKLSRADLRQSVKRLLEMMLRLA